MGIRSSLEECDRELSLLMALLRLSLNLELKRFQSLRELGPVIFGIAFCGGLGRTVSGGCQNCPKMIESLSLMAGAGNPRCLVVN